MKNLKLILLYLKRTTIALLLLLTLYLIGVFVLPHIKFSGENTSSAQHICYLKTNGSHVDIIMPVETALYNWSQYLSLEDIEATQGNYQWVAFGWGDKNFYLNTPSWSDLKFSTAFNAAFGLSSGAIHVTYYDSISENINCKPFVLSDEQLKKLFEFVKSDFSFQKNGGFAPIPTDMNYGSRDAFYDSKKRYSLFHTCNTWVNDALAHIDHKHCLWTALDFGVMNLVDNE